MLMSERHLLPGWRGGKFAYKDKDFIASEFELSTDDKTAATQLTEAVDN